MFQVSWGELAGKYGGGVRTDNNNKRTPRPTAEPAHFTSSLQPTNLLPVSATDDVSNQPWPLVMCTPPNITNPQQAEVAGEGTRKENRKSGKGPTKQKGMTSFSKTQMEKRRFLWIFISENLPVKMRPCILQIQFLFSKDMCVNCLQRAWGTPKYYL